VRRAPEPSLVAVLGAALSLGGCASAEPGRSLTREPIDLAPPAAPIDTATAPVILREREPIDLPTVLELAGERPDAVRLARERLAEMETRVLEGVALGLPSVILGTLFYYHTGIVQQVNGTFLPDVTKQNASLGAVGLMTLDPGSGALAYLAAQRRVDEATLSVESARRETALEAAVDYFELVRAQAGLAIAREALERAVEVRAVAAARERESLGLHVDTRRADADVAAARQAEIAAQSRFRVASARLATVLRLDPTVTLVTSEKAVRRITFIPPEKPVNELIALARANRPDLLAQRRRVEAADLESDAAHLGPFVPTIFAGAGGLGGGLGGLGGFGPTYGSLQGRQDWFLGAGWTLTGLGLGEYARAKAATARLRAELVNEDALSGRADLEVIEAHEAVRSTSEAVAAAEEGLAAAEETRAITRSRFEKGLGLAIEVSAAQEARTRAATALVNAIVEYDEAQYRLLVRIGEVPGR